MMKSPSSIRIPPIFLALLLLLLPVYGYACVLPMMGSDTHASACPLLDCGMGDSHQAAAKYCESLKKAEAQNFSTLNGTFSILKATHADLTTGIQIPQVVSPFYLKGDREKERASFTSQAIYLLHHTLLL